MDEKKTWKELDIKQKIQYSISVFLVICSVVLGFTSFFILYEIPNSIIAVEGLWLSTSLACIGIGLFFRNSLIEYQTKVNAEINRMTETYDKKMNITEGGD